MPQRNHNRAFQGSLEMLTRGRGRHTASNLQASSRNASLGAKSRSRLFNRGLANGPAPASDAAAFPSTLGQAASELFLGLRELSEPLAATV